MRKKGSKEMVIEVKEGKNEFYSCAYHCCFLLHDRRDLQNAF